EPGVANCVHVDDIAQIIDVRQNKVFLTRRFRPQRSAGPHSLDTSITAAQKLVGLVLDPLGHVGVGGPAIGRVVLEPAISGGLCEGVMTMPSARRSLRARL